MKRGGVNERLRAACLQKMPQGAQPPAYNRCLEGHNRLPAIGASRGTTARLQKVPQGAQPPAYKRCLKGHNCQNTEQGQGLPRPYTWEHCPQHTHTHMHTREMLKCAQAKHSGALPSVGTQAQARTHTHTHTHSRMLRQGTHYMHTCKHMHAQTHTHIEGHTTKVAQIRQLEGRQLEHTRMHVNPC